MTTRQARTRRPATNNSQNRSRSGPPAGAYGAEGYRIAKEEAEKAAARREANANSRGPLRFWLNADSSEAPIIILDASLDRVFFMREHEVWDGKARNYIPCLKDVGICPVCNEAEAAGKDSAFKPSYYGMILSVLDTTPYTIQSGDRKGQVIEQTRKLLVVKQSQIDEFYRLLQAAEKMHGTIRGTEIVLTRTGDKEARHGKPVILENGMLFAHWPEADLVAEFGHDPVVKDGKTVRERNQDIMAFDYAEEFPMPNAATLAKAWDLPMPEGSLDAQQAEWDEDEQQAGSGGGASGTRARTRSRAGGGGSGGSPQQGSGGSTRARTRREASPGQSGRQSVSEDLDGDDIPFD